MGSICIALVRWNAKQVREYVFREFSPDLMKLVVCLRKDPVDAKLDRVISVLDLCSFSMNNLVLNIFVDRNKSMVEQLTPVLVVVLVVINRNGRNVDDRYQVVAIVEHREEVSVNVHIVEKKVVEIFV